MEEGYSFYPYVHCSNFFSASARLKKGSKKSDDEFTSDVSQTIAALYIPVMDKLISQI